MRRRSFLGLAGGIIFNYSGARQMESTWSFQYPLRWPNRIPGDSFMVMHGYATENAKFFPNLWHTGENWYALYGDTVGAEVCAVADGEVVFAGYDYPGPVVLIRHAEDLYSQYGHLNYELNIEVGQQVQRGDVIGTVLYRENGRSHLHFELRSFYIQPEVNGESPRYDFYCGYNCPPGPGYWPINAPEHPTDMGWRNPVHVIAHRMGLPTGAEAVVPEGTWGPLFLFEEPGAQIHTQSIMPGSSARFPLLDIASGDEASYGTGAMATSLWYQVQVPEFDRPLWVPAISPTMHAIQQNGQTASYVFNLLPVV